MEMMKLESENAFGNLTEASNEWLEIVLSPGFIALQTIILVYYSSLIIYLLITMVFFYKIKGFVISVTWTTFIFELLGLILILTASFDLAWSRGLFGQNGSSFFSQLYVQFAVLTNLLMAFYFLELFGSSLQSHSPFLDRYKRLFTLIFILGFSVRLILLTLQQMYIIPGRIDTMIGGIILCIQIFVSLLLILCVVIKSNQTLNKYGKNKNFKYLVHTINRFMILCAIGSLSFLVTVLALIMTNITYTTYWGVIAFNCTPILFSFVTVVKIHRLNPNTQVQFKSKSRRSERWTSEKLPPMDKHDQLPQIAGNTPEKQKDQTTITTTTESTPEKPSESIQTESNQSTPEKLNQQ